MDMTTQDLNTSERIRKGVTVLNVSEMPQGNINAEKGQMYLLQGDSYEWLKKIPEKSMDSVVCDPPYLLNFMGKEFDRENGNPADDVEFWKLVLKTMKPGSHLLAAGIGRTHHRVMVAIEDAGFEIRDCIYHAFGSGFPKSHNIEKTLIKMGETEKSKEFAGFGTALKPAVEIWTLARKPLSESTIAENVLKWGTGGINIDGCRVEGEAWKSVAPNKGGRSGGILGKQTEHPGGDAHPQGRFPSNLILDGSDEVVGLFPDTKQVGSAIRKNKANPYGNGRTWSVSETPAQETVGYADSGSASRFFYCAKASKKDRNEGLGVFEEKKATARMNASEFRYEEGREPTPRAEQSINKNSHPTVKPTSLMQYLVRLVTPKGGTVLDPFMGSGSTGKACILEGFDFIGIELDPEYCKIAEARIEHAKTNNI